MPVITSRQARLGLQVISPSSNHELHALVDESAELGAWLRLMAVDADCSPLARAAQAVDFEAIEEATAVCGARFVVPGDDEWPEQLDDLTDQEVNQISGAPFGLWVKGCQLRLAESVTVTGSRASTTYGDRVTQDLAEPLVAGGLTVVTSSSYGIDAAAIRGALVGGDELGRVVVVAACGLDSVYPRALEPLWEEVEIHGTVVSELPPGTPVSRLAFQRRARLLAGLSQGTVVVEAAPRSGARATATWATRLGRTLMAVPGPTTSISSAIPHELIRSGDAQLVASAEQVREALDTTTKEDHHA